MPISPRQNLLCSYRYDALDRSINWAPIRQAGIQRFHCKDRLVTEIQDSFKHSIFQHDDQVLAQQQHMGDKVDITLLTTDLQGSVLSALDAHRPHPIAYTPYGHRLPSNGLFSLLAYNGERPDPVTGHYHLGNGYRQFNPVLMRFNSPDSLSPFGKGGINAYLYCGANPIHRIDSNGRKWEFVIPKMKADILQKTGRPMMRHTEKAIQKYSDEIGTGSMHEYDMAVSVAKPLWAHLTDDVILRKFSDALPGERLQLMPEIKRSITIAKHDILVLEDLQVVVPNHYFIKDVSMDRQRNLTKLKEIKKGLKISSFHNPQFYMETKNVRNP